MSENSKIEWTDTTWNPVRGCTKVSEGCRNCYAETFAERWRGIPGHPYEQGFGLRLVPEKLEEPSRWKKPRRIFVNSMSDLFQDGVSDSYIWRVFNEMRRAKQHTFQVLTKRAERMARWFEFINPTVEAGGFEWPLPNVWMGVSVEGPKHLGRIDHLRRVPAAVRFISFEPLLEEIAQVDLTLIHWVIIGGESGPGARPCDLSWVRRLMVFARDRSMLRDLPTIFIKQLGAHPTYNGPIPDARFHLESRKGNDMNEWPEDLRVREFPR